MVRLIFGATKDFERCLQKPINIEEDIQLEYQIAYLNVFNFPVHKLQLQIGSVMRLQIVKLHKHFIRGKIMTGEVALINLERVIQADAQKTISCICYYYK